MKEQAHTRYKTSDGVIVPSVTTILSLLNKPALVPWANKLGLQGIDSSKYVDKLAEIGTLTHQMILDYFRKEIVRQDMKKRGLSGSLLETTNLSYIETDFSEYSPECKVIGNIYENKELLR